MTEAIGSPHIDIPEGVKQMAAASISQVCEGYEKLCDNAEAMTDTVEQSCTMAMRDAADFHETVLRTIQANLAATFEFTTDLLGARSLPEVIELYAHFGRRQFETLSLQSTDFFAFGKRMMGDTARPLASGFSEGVERAIAS